MERTLSHDSEDFSMMCARFASDVNDMETGDLVWRRQMLSTFVYSQELWAGGFPGSDMSPDWARSYQAARNAIRIIRQELHSREPWKYGP